MPKQFSVPEGIDPWRPAQFTPASWTWRKEGSRLINVVARLAPGVSLESAQSDLHRIGEQLRHEHADTDGLWQFEAIAIRNDLYGELKPAILVLFVASCFLLLVACINAANPICENSAGENGELPGSPKAGAAFHNGYTA